ncbi:MAG: hypothetical protein NZM11_12215, partial [Anaerolineales bacterium]|nr:hypothetical protein [Anaerolineales bacterium]
AARLFPFPLGVFWLAVLIAARRGTPKDTGQGASHSPRAMPFAQLSTFYFLLFTLSAALTFAPLGLYFIQHPEDFFNRAAQIVARPGDENLLWQGIRRAAEMVFLDGEPYDRFNLPGLPLFPLPLGAFFVIGLLSIIIGLLRLLRPVQRNTQYAIRNTSSHLILPASLLLIVWLPFMLLPTALSVYDIFPSNVRAFGLTPLVFVFPALGIVATYRFLQKHWPGPLIGVAYPLTVLTLIVLAIGTYATYRLYFVEWANLRSQR